MSQLSPEELWWVNLVSVLAAGAALLISTVGMLHVPRWCGPLLLLSVLALVPVSVRMAHDLRFLKGTAFADRRRCFEAVSKRCQLMSVLG